MRLEPLGFGPLGLMQRLECMQGVSFEVAAEAQKLPVTDDPDSEDDDPLSRASWPAINASHVLSSLTLSPTARSPGKSAARASPDGNAVSGSFRPGSFSLGGGVQAAAQGHSPGGSTAAAGVATPQFSVLDTDVEADAAGAAVGALERESSGTAFSFDAVLGNGNGGGAVENALDNDAAAAATEEVAMRDLQGLDSVSSFSAAARAAAASAPDLTGATQPGVGAAAPEVDLLAFDSPREAVATEARDPLGALASPREVLSLI